MDLDQADQEFAGVLGKVVLAGGIFLKISSSLKYFHVTGWSLINFPRLNSFDRNK
jgi:hypothetical protein